MDWRREIELPSTIDMVAQDIPGFLGQYSPGLPGRRGRWSYPGVSPKIRINNVDPLDYLEMLRIEAHEARHHQQRSSSSLPIEVVKHPFNHVAQSILNSAMAQYPEYWDPDVADSLLDDLHRGRRWRLQDDVVSIRVPERLAEYLGTHSRAGDLKTALSEGDAEMYGLEKSGLWLRRPGVHLRSSVSSSPNWHYPTRLGSAIGSIMSLALALNANS